MKKFFNYSRSLPNYLLIIFFLLLHLGLITSNSISDIFYKPLSFISYNGIEKSPYPCAISDNNIFFYGSIGVSKDVVVLNKNNHSWIRYNNSLSEKRYGSSQVGIKNLVIFGGNSPSVDIFNETDNTFKNILLNLSGPMWVSASNNKVAVFFGGYYNGYKYNLTSNQWTSIGIMNPYYIFISCSTLGEKFVCAGGWIGASRYSDTISLYDPNQNKWYNHIGNLSIPRTHINILEVSDYILFIGGSDANNIINYPVVDIYDKNSSSLTKLKSMNLTNNITNAAFVYGKGFFNQKNTSYLYVFNETSMDFDIINLNNNFNYILQVGDYIYLDNYSGFLVYSNNSNISSTNISATNITRYISSININTTNINTTNYFNNSKTSSKINTTTLLLKSHFSHPSSTVSQKNTLLISQITSEKNKIIYIIILILIILIILILFSIGLSIKLHSYFNHNHNHNIIKKENNKNNNNDNDNITMQNKSSGKKSEQLSAQSSEQITISNENIIQSKSSGEENKSSFIFSPQIQDKNIIYHNLDNISDNISYNLNNNKIIYHNLENIT